MRPKAAASMSLKRFRQISERFALYDFLVPSLQMPRNVRGIRQLSMTTTQWSNSNSTSSMHARVPPSDGTQVAGAASEAAFKPAPSKKALTQAQRDFLTSALRVNQAGELAATLIYSAQTPPIIKAHPQLRPLMKHMYDQEAGHFETWNALMAKHRIRPTAMYPVWSLAATVLGWGTAIMGREAAMACTEAVETEIGEHYNGQVRALLEMFKTMEENGEVVEEELRDLTESIRRIRDEELEHLDHAVENDAKEAVPHALLTGVIRAGCRGAIWVTERV